LNTLISPPFQSKYAQNANKGDPVKRKAAIDQLDKARDNLHKVMKEHLHANNILGPNARKNIEDAIDEVQNSVEAVIDSADKDPKIAKKATLVSDGLDLLDAALDSATAEKATRGMPELLHSAQNAGCDVKRIPKQKGEGKNIEFFLSLSHLHFQHESQQPTEQKHALLRLICSQRKYL